MSVNDNTDLIKSNTFMQYILHTYVLMYYIYIVRGHSTTTLESGINVHP